jgi:hypothetical protein
MFPSCLELPFSRLQELNPKQDPPQVHHRVILNPHNFNSPIRKILRTELRLIPLTRSLSTSRNVRNKVFHEEAGDPNPRSTLALSLAIITPTATICKNNGRGV